MQKSSWGEGGNKENLRLGRREERRGMYVQSGGEQAMRRWKETERAGD